MKTSLLILSCLLTITQSLIAQDGTLDNTFNANAVFSGSGFVHDCRVQTDGKYLAVGGLVIISGSNFYFGITRVNNDGTLDEEFSSGIQSPTTLRAIDLQSDGKIIVAGQSSNIWRLNHDGTIDNTFNATTAGTGPIGAHEWVTKIQTDGKIIVGGAFESVNNITKPRVARLNPDGTVDNTFDTGLGATGGRVIDLAIQSDGKIIIVGAFNQYDGVNRSKIARLNTDGSLDTSFNPGSGADSDIEEVIIQPDGKIIITGSFTSYNNSSTGRIARLNPDGTLDNTFNLSGTGFTNNEQLWLSIQSDGKILVGGNSSQFNGNSVPKLVRLNTDGSLDNTFNSGGTGPDAKVWAIVIQSDGKIIIGGDFSDYNGTTSRRLARLNGSNTTSIENINNDFSFNFFPNPSNEFITVNGLPINSTVKIFDITGKVVYNSPVQNEQTTINLSNLTNGVYIIQAENNGFSANRKLVVNKQ